MRFTKAVAAGAAVIGLGLLSAPAAAADESSYLYELHNAGFSSPGGDSTFLSWGYAVCEDNNLGLTVEESAANIDSATSLTYEDAMFVVMAAQVYLC